jgi:DNA-binding Xre family transcriptional regulator
MISHGFSLRHYQLIEAGRPIAMTTLLRVCEAFDISPEQLIDGLGQHLRKRRKT